MSEPLLLQALDTFPGDAPMLALGVGGTSKVAGIEGAAVDHVANGGGADQENIGGFLNGEKPFELGDAEIGRGYFRGMSDASGEGQNAGCSRNRGRKRNAVFHLSEGR